MRRLITAPIGLALLLCAGWSVCPAGLLGAFAQPAAPLPSATLTLVSQSAWNDVKHPLRVTVAATNTSSEPLSSLSLELSIEAPALSRSVYELSLRADATLLLAQSQFPQEGTLEPGESRTFSLVQKVDQLAGRGDNGLYPLRIQLLSSEVVAATFRTPMLFLIESPKVPLNFAWTWVLAETIQYDPAGVFLPGSIETDIASGGRLADAVQALQSANDPVDLVVSSALVDQLQRMAGGYRIRGPFGRLRTVLAGQGGAAEASALLQSLASLAARPGTELVSLPLGDADESALIKAGLTASADSLLTQGRELVGGALGAAPSTSVVRPVFSRMDAPGVERYGRLGTRIALIDTGFFPMTPELRLSAPPVARVVGRRATVDAVLPDPGVNDQLTAAQTDPVLAAHAALGELASIWLEAPGTVGRGAAVLFPETPTVSAATLAAFAPLVAKSLWLHTVSATGLVAAVGDLPRFGIGRRTYPTFPEDYVASIQEARNDLTQFRNTATGADRLIDELGQNVQISQSSTFLSDPRFGEPFLDAVDRRIKRTYGAVHLAVSVITLTSRQGLIPLTIVNASGYRLHLLIHPVSDLRLTFEGGSRAVVLTSKAQTITFRVHAATTGRIPVTIRLQTLGTTIPPETIGQAQLVVRSTAYNRVALFFTIGAAVFLLAWWARKLVPHRKP